MARPPLPAVPPPAVPPPSVPLPADPPPAGPPGPPPVGAVPRAVPPVAPPSTLPARIEEPSPTLGAASPLLGGAPVVAPESRMLPPHQTKLDRVTGHLAALSADLREWTELRIDLVKRQIEGIQAQIERFQHYANAAGFFVPAALLALTAVLFLFVTIALGIGALLGSVAWGFFVTTVLLLVGAAVLGWLGLRSVRRAQERAAEARRRERDTQSRDREKIQSDQEESVRNAAA
ncbi:LysE family transporter [Rubrivirga sp.]|uniref:LysE family transporter n=1 Tax=Rubrivirga sp. TaxID=1885344 RepID=UPI003B523066